MFNLREEDIPLIPGIPKENWIPSDKFLPETNGIYLCVVETQDELFGLQRDVHCCYFNHNTKKFYWDSLNTNVPYWAPIPKIPPINNNQNTKIMNNIPEFFIQQSEAYKKIVELMKTFHNDQDLGREVRKYLYAIKEQTNDQRGN